MDKTVYLVLLRGINIGGNNIIKMDELKRLFEAMEFSNVTTYIQSGNVLCTAVERDKIKLTEKIEAVLFERLNRVVKVSALSLHELREVITEKPQGFGDDDENYKYDVVFLIEPLTANEAVKHFSTKDGVDTVYKGKNAVYFRRVKEHYRKSYFSKIAGSPIYQNITIRNWNTTKKLYELTAEIT
ncbi:MAG: DUF1697 domain-containing protein [Treponema sp.]|jgi:uncharacterized protein (DUF1697 family)|nr:DUF1697 domain-containing protein [Treponema sp.]